MNDSNLQQLLLQTEVTPPEMVWEKITLGLDEQQSDQPLQQKILQLEEEVPVLVWNNLEAHLNDLALQKKIESIEEVVPPMAWEQIALALDVEQNDQAVAATLHALEVAPPSNVWDSIEAGLDEQQAKVIPMKGNGTRIFRLAAAAAITGILAWGGYRLISTESTEQTTTIAAAEAPVTNNLVIPSPVQQESIEEEEQQEETSPTRVQIKERIKQNLKLNDAVAYIETPDHSLENYVPYQGIHHQKQLAPQETSGFSESQYYMLLNDDGELVRVSKKITDLKCVAVSNSATATQQELKDCNDQLKRWREKMAMAAAFSASAGDIDLNQLINSVSDQQ